MLQFKSTNQKINTIRARKTNLELCRIICMLLIIAHHYVVHGGALNMATYPNRYVALAVYPGGKICFVAFLALSTWFLSQQKFHFERFLKIWLEVAFYSIVFTILFAVISGENLSIFQWISVFFPIIGNSHGFASAYLSLYLLLPFLSMAVKNINKKQTEFLLLLLFIFQIGSSIMGNLTGYTQPLASELLLFIFCYFISFYLRNWPKRFLDKKLSLVIVIICVWLFLIIINYLYWKVPENTIVLFLLNISGTESSLVNLIGGFSFFFLFNSIKMPTIKSINCIAKTTFGILLMHDHNFFRPIVWNVIFQTHLWYESRLFIVHLVATSLLLYILGSIIDMVRITFLEKPLMNMNWLKKICAKCDRLLNGGVNNE